MRRLFSVFAGRHVAVAALSSAAVTATTTGWAQLDVTGLERTHPQVIEALGRSTLHGALLIEVTASEPVARPLRSTEPSTAGNPVRISEHWSALPSRVGVELETDGRMFWGPPRRLLLDKAARSIRLDDYVRHTELIGDVVATGNGVVVGFADSGVDFVHPDLQQADGTTRVAWFIDFAASPYGLHPELEREFGCTKGEAFSCGVLSAVEIDSLLSGERLTTPEGRRISLATDQLGHGTHVTSLAAGAGRADPRYRGIAPEATLVIARVASVSSSVSDVGVLAATRFIFDRADALGMPAVVNLSLGGDFGPHDGSAAVGRALEELVEPPGRALVVAAGNSGSLFVSDTLPYPQPFGIHTEVHLPPGDATRVPLLVPRGHAALEGSVFVWVGTRQHDQVAIGLETASGETLLPPISVGDAALRETEELELVIVNRVDAADVAGAEDLSAGAAVVMNGRFEPGSVFAVTLQGGGNVQLWVQAEGQLSNEQSEGVVFPSASRSGTITIPAVSPELIAVGATVNRLSWPSRDDGKVALLDFGSARGLEVGEPAFFSSDGPNLDGWMKPDVLAPGMAVVGAMAAAADPVTRAGLDTTSIFAYSPVCDASEVCAVISDDYALTLGTSMAAPIVTGALALLFESEPALTQAEVLRLLQAGVQRVGDSKGQAAPGLLDVAASFEALRLTEAGANGEAPAPQHSWLSFSDIIARPDPSWGVTARLRLRDARERLTAVDLDELDVQVENGLVLGRVTSPAPGLVEFEVAAGPSTAGERLKVNVEYRGEHLARQSMPIALDVNVAARGVSLRGGCALSPGPARVGMGWGGVLLLVWARRRHGKLREPAMASSPSAACSCEAPRVPRQDRRDGARRRRPS